MQRRGYIQRGDDGTVHSQYKGGIFDPNGEVYNTKTKHRVWDEKRKGF